MTSEVRRTVDLQKTFSAQASSVSAARHWVQLLLVRRQASADLATLLVSELATNAVHHANTPFRVCIRWDDDNAFTIAVHDHSRVIPLPASPGPLDSGGRGLLMIAALADAWGVEPHDDGKAIWFRLPIQPCTA